MKINNVTKETSLTSVVYTTVLSVMLTSIVIALYFMFTIDTPSFIGFFHWVIMSIEDIARSDIQDKWFLLALITILPIVSYFGLIGSIIKRKLALKKIALGINLKSVEFLPDRINLFFNDSKYNFVCGYSEIKKLEMVLCTDIMQGKYGPVKVLTEIKLIFNILNDKKLEITNIPFNKMKFIYSVIDYSRKINAFDYRFEGNGVINDVDEKIQNYLKKGTSILLSTEVKYFFKYLSLGLFAIGIFFLYSFKDLKSFRMGYNTDLIVLFLIPIFTSFIFDIILIVNEITEKKKARL